MVELLVIAARAVSRILATLSLNPVIVPHLVVILQDAFVCFVGIFFLDRLHIIHLSPPIFPSS